jgi:hypothetical protein
MKLLVQLFGEKMEYFKILNILYLLVMMWDGQKLLTSNIT